MAGGGAVPGACRALLLCALLSGAAGSSPSASPALGVAARIAAALPAAQTLLGASARRHGGSRALQAAYAASGDKLIWIRAGRLTAQAEALWHTLRQAQDFGLESADYLPPEIGGRAARTPPAAPDDADGAARLDVALSAAALHFVADLHYGRVLPVDAGFELRDTRADLDFVAVLESLSGGSDAAATLAAVEPQFYHYRLLKQALARLRQVSSQADFAQLPPPPARLKVGGTYAGAAPLRRMLRTIGDLPPGDGDGGPDARFDSRLSDAVRRYQRRHGLAPTGTLDRPTFAELRTPPARRIRQLELTLERWRWLSPFKTPPIIVNIPQFRLFAFRTLEDRAADILQMDVIVGRTYPRTQTPVFQAQMRYVVLRPYWDVPYSITVREMLPKLRANPAYLAAQHLEIVAAVDGASTALPATPENLAGLATGRLRLRQQPGEDNALGLIKFVFPNAHSVYLHSTPAHALFREPVRAFSHGCIRVSDPLALAALVLKNAPGDWPRDKIQAVIQGSTTVRVDLTTPIDVLILYATALATEAGPIMFFDDIYGYDRRLERRLGLEPVATRG